MVRSACKLESKYSNHGRRHRWYYGSCMECQCRKRDQNKDAGEGEVLSLEIVSYRYMYFLINAGKSLMSCDALQLEQANYRARTRRSSQRIRNK